jgi:hypothetical protein
MYIKDTKKLTTNEASNLKQILCLRPSEREMDLKSELSVEML